MAFNGSGTFERVHDWTTDRNNGTKIEAERMDAEHDGFATGLSNCIAKDGQSTPTANIPFGGFKLTNVGDATSATDAVNRQTGDGRYILQTTGAVAAEVSVTSAATADILGAASQRVLITGSTGPITSFGTGTNRIRFVRFDSTPTLTHHATSLILPGGVNIVAAAGDTCIVVSDASSNARVLAYQRANATAAQYRSKTTGPIPLTPEQVWDAAAEVTLTDAATVAVDLSTGINFVLTLGGNRTLGNPSNQKVGQCGVIRIVQDGTGTRTLSYSSDWEFASGSAPVLSTTAADQDLLFYHVIATDRVFGALVKDIS